MHLPRRKIAAISQSENEPPQSPNMPGGTENIHEFAQLLTAARGGSTEALGMLFAGLRTRLLSQAYREFDADFQAKFAGSDVVQETFLRAQRGFAGFAGNDESALLAWLRQVLKNHLSNLRRNYHTDKRAIGRERPVGVADSRQTIQPVPAARLSSLGSRCVRVEETDRLESMSLQIKSKGVISLRRQNVGVLRWVSSAFVVS